MKKYFGILANMNFLLVYKYGENGSNQEIILYKKDKKYIKIDINQKKMDIFNAKSDKNYEGDYAT